MGFIHNNEIYYYLKNAQVDIVSIADKDSNIVAKYTYDSLGKLVSIKDENGVDKTNDTTFGGEQMKLEKFFKFREYDIKVVPEYKNNNSEYLG